MNHYLRRTQAGLAAAIALAALGLGCSPQPSAIAAVISEKVYLVTPDAVQAQGGSVGRVTGEVAELRIIEHVAQSPGRVASPARLSGKLMLKNVSADQIVLLVGGKVSYTDREGRPIASGGSRTDPTVRIASSFGAYALLEPGQGATQVVDVEFPLKSLRAKRLKEIGLELSYVASPSREGNYPSGDDREETLKFTVSIGGK